MIPKIRELEQPLLKILATKSPMTWNECTVVLSEQFHLSPTERDSLMPNGKCGTMKYRVGWAKANLKRLGLVEAPSRGVYSITEKGRAFLRNK